MKKVFLLILLMFSCSAEDIKTNEQFEERSIKEIRFEAPAGDYANQIEYLEALEIVSIDNGRLDRISFETYQGKTYQMFILDENFDLLIINDVSFGQYWSDNQFPLADRIPKKTTFYLHFVKDNLNNIVNVYKQINL